MNYGVEIHLSLQHQYWAANVKPTLFLSLHLWICQELFIFPNFAGALLFHHLQINRIVMGRNMYCIIHVLMPATVSSKQSRAPQGTFKILLKATVRVSAYNNIYNNRDI